MNKSQLIEVIAAKTNLTKTKSEAALEAISEAMENSLKKGERVSFPHFGTFTVNHRNARTGRNPKTGEEIRIKAKKTIKFRPSSKLIF